MPERPVQRETPDPVLEALLAVARSAIRIERDGAAAKASRRATMTVVDGGKRGGDA
jgi:hypothetical protein